MVKSLKLKYWIEGDQQSHEFRYERFLFNIRYSYRDPFTGKYKIGIAQHTFDKILN